MLSLYAEEDTLDDVLASSSEGEVILVKFHQPTETATRLVEAGRALNVFTYRNPLDSIASLMDAFGEPFESALTGTETGLLCHDLWSARPGTLFIEYDRVVAGGPGPVRDIAGHLGLTADVEAMASIAADLHWTSLKPETDAMMATVGTAGLKQNFDPVTHLHPGHIRKADKRSGQQELTPDQLNIALERLSKWVGARSA